MKTNLELSIEIAYNIAKMLNHTIETDGEIKINNKTIWKGYLHQMDNNVWYGLVDLLEQLQQQSPGVFKPYDEKNLADARAALDKHSPYYDNVLDMKNRHLDNKKIAWRMLMTVREVWNRCCDIHLPNSDKSKVLNNFKDIIE
jgi:hypothetical protein